MLQLARRVERVDVHCDQAGAKDAGQRHRVLQHIRHQRSAIFPGWGQAYNESYWKIPIFYAGYGVFVWWRRSQTTPGQQRLRARQQENGGQ
ncbi:MAG: DUF5683 domain-containing protein, partial [Pseudomonadota bacterium]